MLTKEIAAVPYDIKKTPNRVYLPRSREAGVRL
jgi:hypothetical protein